MVYSCLGIDRQANADLYCHARLIQTQRFVKKKKKKASLHHIQLCICSFVSSSSFATQNIPKSRIWISPAYTAFWCKQSVQQPSFVHNRWQKYITNSMKMRAWELWTLKLFGTSNFPHLGKNCIILSAWKEASVFQNQEILIKPWRAALISSPLFLMSESCSHNSVCRSMHHGSKMPSFLDDHLTEKDSRSASSFPQ